MGFNIAILLVSFWVVSWLLAKAFKPTKGAFGRWLKANLVAGSAVIVYVLLTWLKEYMLFESVYGDLIESKAATYGEVVMSIFASVAWPAILGLLIGPVVLVYAGWNKPKE